MIWVLVSTFLLAGEPVGAATYNAQNWPTEQACKDFLASPDGKKNITALKAIVAKASHGAKIEIKTACVGKEDNSI